MINTILMRLAGLSYLNALILAVGAGLLYMWSPIYNDGSRVAAEVQNLKGRLAQEQTKANESDEALKEVDRARRSVGALQEQFKVVAQQLPTELAMSDVLRNVDTLARTSGVSVKDKEPRTPQRLDFLDLIPLRLKAEGTFSELTMFVYYLSSTQRIARIKSFTLGSLSGRDGRLSFDGELVNYRFVPEAAQKKPEAGKPK